MTPSQKKAVQNHRQRQAKKGIVRLEISVPERDRRLLRAAAANLRAGGDTAEKTRAALSSLLGPYAGMNFKEFLEAAPLEGLELKRSKETWREIDLELFD